MATILEWEHCPFVFFVPALYWLDKCPFLCKIFENRHQEFASQLFLDFPSATICKPVRALLRALTQTSTIVLKISEWLSRYLFHVQFISKVRSKGITRCAHENPIRKIQYNRRTIFFLLFYVFLWMIFQKPLCVYEDYPKPATRVNGLIENWCAQLSAQFSEYIFIS